MSKPEEFSKLLPSYLTDATRESLKKALKGFLESKQITQNPFSNYNQDFFLQGDIIKGVPFPYWEKGQFNYHPNSNCILLTNTCDMDLNNSRIFAVDCTLAPVISVDKYQGMMRKNGVNEERIDAFYTDLIEYRLTNLFYLPLNESFEYSRHDKGYFVALDKGFSLPRRAIDMDQTLCSLNQFYSYLFNFQLSVNFCRFHDKVDRETIH